MSAVSPFRGDVQVGTARDREPVPYELEGRQSYREASYSGEAAGPPTAETALMAPEADEREDEFEHGEGGADAVFERGDESVAEPELWQSDLEDERALPEPDSAASTVRPEEEEDEDEDVGGERTLRATEVAEEGAVIPEELEAVDPFPPAERRSLAPPLMTAAVSAKAVAWNAARHPSVSGVDPAAIRAALENYVDLPTIQAEIQAANAKGAGIALGTPPVDSVLVEAVHQFQRKCYTEPRQADGWVGESTLDSLGVVSTSPQFNTVDEVHVKARKALQGAEKDIETATAGRHTADNWFENMVNPAFLGRTFTKGIHAVLAARLRIAERHLLAQPGFKGKTPAALGQALQIAEQHRGARPHKPKSSSMHTAGLAVDINYTGNPWVGGNPETPVGNKHFTEVVGRATLLIGGAALRTDERLTPEFLNRLSTRPTSEIYARLELYDRYFRGYFALDGALDAIRVRLLAHQLRLHAETLRLIIHTGEDVDAAARRWLEQIRKDQNALKGGNFGKGREPRHGFLNLHKELVVALRDVAGLAWGAVDFGDEQSGDMMHFDCRRDGVGRIVSAALRGRRVSPEPAAFSWGVWGGEVAVADEGPAEEGETLALDGDVASFEEAEGFFGTATTAIRNGWDAIRTRARIANGVVDENQLTNLVFFDRHPNRAGRELSPSEPDFAALPRGVARHSGADCAPRVARLQICSLRPRRRSRLRAEVLAPSVRRPVRRARREERKGLRQGRRGDEVRA